MCSQLFLLLVLWMDESIDQSSWQSWQMVERLRSTAWGVVMCGQLGSTVGLGPGHGRNADSRAGGRSSHDMHSTCEVYVDVLN